MMCSYLRELQDDLIFIGDLQREILQSEDGANSTSDGDDFLAWMFCLGEWAGKSSTPWEL